jgi:hypothetical protein
MIDVKDVRGDMMLKATLRQDLAPVPLTFEGVFRTTTQTAAQFKDGAVLVVNDVPMRIVKAVPQHMADGGVQGKEPFSGTHVTAFPDGLQALALPRTAAAIFEGGSLAGAYRSCGSTVPLAGDFELDLFSCHIGEIPTFALARALQEMGGVVMWRGKGMKVMPFRDLFAQTPITALTVDSSESVNSGHLVADQIPVFYSIAPDGSIISAPRKNAAQKLAYTPRKTQAQLNAMGRVLVNKRAATTTINPALRAGDMLNVQGTPMVLMTVAHHLNNGSDGGGGSQYTRVWLGVLSQ